MISVAVILGAHGIKGEVKLRSFAADAQSITRYALITAAGVSVKIEKLRTQKDGFIAVLSNVRGRDAAEALKGVELFVARADLPEPEPGEVYLGDLIGLGVWLADGKKLGEVVAVPNYGAGDLLEVKRADRHDSVLIPFSKTFVSSTDVNGGRIVADLPDGFLDIGGGE